MKLLVTHEVDVHGGFCDMSAFLIRIGDFFVRCAVLAVFGVWYE